MLRILQRKLFGSHVPTLYSEFNTVPITLLHEQQLLILPQEIIHHSESVPEIFIDYLNSNDSVDSHNTRTKMICIFLGSLLTMTSTSNSCKAFRSVLLQLYCQSVVQMYLHVVKKSTEFNGVFQVEYLGKTWLYFRVFFPNTGKRLVYR